MTRVSPEAYFPYMLDGWQHSGAFVVRFSPNTNPNAQQFCGRVEHVATGKVVRFESIEELIHFINRILQEVREKFEQADTLAEEMPPATQRPDQSKRKGNATKF